MLNAVQKSVRTKCVQNKTPLAPHLLELPFQQSNDVIDKYRHEEKDCLRARVRDLALAARSSQYLGSRNLSLVVYLMSVDVTSKDDRASNLNLRVNHHHHQHSLGRIGGFLNSHARG